MKKLLFKKEIPPGVKKGFPIRYYNKDDKLPIYSFEILCHSQYKHLVECFIEDHKFDSNYAKMLKVHNKFDMPIWVEVYEEEVE